MPYLKHGRMKNEYSWSFSFTFLALMFSHCWSPDFSFCCAFVALVQFLSCYHIWPMTSFVDPSIDFWKGLSNEGSLQKQFASTWVLRFTREPILVPRAHRFLDTWLRNEGLWKQPLPDVRKFLTSGRARAKVTNITAHARNGYLSLAAPLEEKFYFPSSLQRVASLGCFENAPLHSTWIHW